MLIYQVQRIDKHLVPELIKIYNNLASALKNKPTYLVYILYLQSNINTLQTTNIILL